jgi:hypothetical protein
VTGQITQPLTVASSTTLIGTASITTIGSSVTFKSNVGVAGQIDQPLTVTSSATFTNTTNGVLISTLAFTPTTSGIKGTPTNDSAAGGFVGEYKSSSTVVNTSFLGTTVWTDGLSVSLTPGDWDVSVQESFSGNGATVSEADCGISLTAGNTSAGLTVGDNESINVPGTGQSTFFLNASNWRVSTASTVPVYFKARSVYSVAVPFYTARLSARRVR